MGLAEFGRSTREYAKQECEAVVLLRRSSDRRKGTHDARDPGDAERRPSQSNRSRQSSRNGVELDGRRAEQGRFVLYVEGPRDREILVCWARRVDRDLARVIDRHAVILGGRRPARALSDFRKSGGDAAGRKGIVVLDRDDHHSATIDAGLAELTHETGLDVFIWGRRHIESYLLVPAALRRLVGLDSDDRRIERFVEAAEEDAESLDAKRILGAGGSLAAVVGTELRAGEIARIMRPDELHSDVIDLFDRISRASGVANNRPEVVVRPRGEP